MTLWIVAAGISYNVYELLVYFVDQSVGFVLAVGAAPPVPKGLPAELFVL